MTHLAHECNFDRALCGTSRDTRPFTDSLVECVVCAEIYRGNTCPHCGSAW